MINQCLLQVEHCLEDFPDGSVDRNLPTKAQDMDLIPYAHFCCETEATIKNNL